MLRIIGMLLIGLAAGWIAAQLTTSKKPGLVGMMIIGVAGSFVGGIAFNLLGLTATGIVGQLVIASCGAIACVKALQRWV